MKARACLVCKAEYTQQRIGQKACGYQCALVYASQKNAKAKALEFNRETKRLKDGIKKRSVWMKEAQIEFNKLIRARDRGQPCISCQRTEAELHHDFIGGAWDCGHYMAVGSHPELRFNELNAHRQCKKCNNQLSGNHANYRRGLIEKVGLSVVEWLEGPKEPRKATIDELKWLKQHYKDKVKELNN